MSKHLAEIARAQTNAAITAEALLLGGGRVDYFEPAEVSLALTDDEMADYLSQWFPELVTRILASPEAQVLCMDNAADRAQLIALFGPKGD